MSSPFRITAALWDRIHHFASFPQAGVSLQQMVLFGQNPSQGTLFKGSQFLLEELPIRLAHRAKELDELPHDLSGMPSINKVKNWYCQSFEQSLTHRTSISKELINFPKFFLTPEVKKALYSHHGHHKHKLPEAIPNPSIMESVAGVEAFYDQDKGSEGFYNGYGSNSFGFGNGGNSTKPSKLRIPIERRYYAPPGMPDMKWPPEMHAFNASFTNLLQKIKRRHDPTVTTVAQGVLEWKRSRGDPKETHIGMEMQQWLDRFYLSRIGIRFLIGQHIALNTLEPHPDYVGIIFQLICKPDLHFAYVPGHLSHICFELLKNSLRAVVERFGVAEAVAAPEKLPPIKVIVGEGREDITIKISDEGGGIPRSAIPLVWTYMYTTMANQGIQDDFTDSDFKAPMAGFGYGLPLSRLYARYFGGDLKLISMEGYGTDVYIHLNRLSSSREPLQ
ncbi:alpha-ketoacid dehydrogenase kinase [Sanghuangporus baumii]|uniref:Protein-serine/threonine kinase n=1 Tax=Sanghuangporus baumii TaxID=108892 RepID=A0A9Q5I013_SANBA|nr:alpha-ketoacid dehydrogenase kinase [Sanghuangporus baumii]